MASGGQRDIEHEIHFARTPTSESWQYAKRELSFLASEEYTNASSGDTANMFLKNPSGSGTSAIVTDAGGNAATKSYVRIYDGFDNSATGGSNVDVENNLMDKGGEGSFDSGVMTVESDVSITPSNTFRSRVTGGATTGVGGEAGRLLAEPFIMEPGRRILIEVKKLASGDDEATITADWFEFDGVFTESEAQFPPMTF